MKTPTRAKPADTCRMTIHIRGTAYGVKPVANPDGRAYRLRHLDGGAAYDVAEGEHGPTCDCQDAVWRHDDGSTFCKHVRALAALGLITLTVASDPRTWPTWTDSACYAAGR